MPISFSTGGSTFGDPTKGLIGNLTKALGFSQPQQSPTYGQVTGVLAPNQTGQNKNVLSSTQSVPPQKGMVPTHPVSSITTNADGTTKHTFDTKGIGTSAGSSTGGSSSSTGSPTPQAGTTGTERANAVIQAGAPNADVAAATQAVQTGLGLKNVGNIGQYAEQGAYTGANPNTPEGRAQLTGLISRPDLAGRASGEAGLYGQLANLYGTQSNAALQSALAEQGLGLNAATSVLGAGAPTGNIINVDPFTGKPVAGGSLEDSAKQSGTISGIQSGAAGLASGYQSGLATLRAADTIQNQITNTLKNNPDLNTNPISLLTNLNQYVSGQIGSAPQQLLTQQIQSYIQTLGIDPATLVNIAHQSQGTMAQLLDSLRATAQAKVESQNISGSSTSGSSTGGGLYSF